MNKRKRVVLIVYSYIIILFSSVFASNAQGFNFKDQLSDAQKQLYNRFVLNMQPGITEIDLTNVYNNKTYTQQEFDNFGSNLQRDTQASLDAFLADYPEFYWLKFGAGGIGSNYSYSKIGPIYKINSVVFNVVVADKYLGQVDNLNTQMNNIINNFNVVGQTRYDKVKAIHDYLCQLITYDASFNFAHEPVGALVYGKAVCEGYAESFKLICDKAGIPNVLVSGVGTTTSGSELHMWNYVQMEDDKWYAVDITWDDHSQIYYDFFLVGSNTKDTHFGKKTFSVSHVPNGDLSGSGLFTFSYPVLNTSAYVVSTPTPTPTNTIAPTNTPTPEPTNTPIPELTNTPTPTPTNTPIPVSTNTPTLVPTNTPTPVQTNTTKPTNTADGETTPDVRATENINPTATSGDESTNSPSSTSTPKANDDNSNTKMTLTGLVLAVVIGIVIVFAVSAIFIIIILAVKKRKTKKE